VDLPALATTIARFSQLAAGAAGLDELELNPLVAGPAAVVAVDARATLAPLLSAIVKQPRPVA
jgi:hypothetical protein